MQDDAQCGNWRWLDLPNLRQSAIISGLVGYP